MQPLGNRGVSLQLLGETWITPTLTTLDRTDEQSALVIDVMYGGVGREVWRQGHRRLVAIWPLTKAGQGLISMASRRHRRDIDTIVGELNAHQDRWNELRAARIRRAEDSALALWARAKRALFEADQQAECRVLRAAEALQRKAARRAWS